MTLYRILPGAGFLCLVFSTLVAGVFFAWGLERPPLDDVWRLQIKLQQEDGRVLDAGERHEVEQALLHHAELATSWLDGARLGIVSHHESGVVEDGVAYVVQDAGGAGELRVVATGEVRINVTSSAGKAAGRATRQQAFSARLAKAARPLLWEVRVDPPQPVRLELSEIR